MTRVRVLVGLEGSAILIPGNAHLGLEIGLRNLTPPQAKVLVAENGFWGCRLGDIAKCCGYIVSLKSFPENRPISADGLAETLRSGDFDTLAIVHGESSTGVLNDLEAVAHMCREYDTSLLVDAVATLGVVPVDCCISARSIVVASVVKGIGSEPGLVLVLLSSLAERYVADRAHPVGYFSDLRFWVDATKESFGDVPTIGSVSVSQFRVLEGSITDIEDEGIEARLKRHRNVSEYARKGLLALQFQPINESSPLPTITAATVPISVNASDVVRSLGEQGIYVDSGMDPHNSIIRIGHMSESANVEVLNDLFHGLRLAREELLGK